MLRRTALLLLTSGFLGAWSVCCADTLTILYDDGTKQAVSLSGPSSAIAGISFGKSSGDSRGDVRNLSLGKRAEQSSVGWGGDPARAVDGNTSGNFANNSVSHTESQLAAWWQVDLGSSHTIQKVRIWNRTDCCAERLTRFYVLVSNSPFPPLDPRSVPTLPGVWSYYHEGEAGTPSEIPVRARGRYVRVQLAEANYLQLAEVEVIGE